MRIAIVDDCEVDRYLAKRAIARALPDAQVEEFEDPRDAVVAANRGELPALLLLDLNMPRMNGFDVLDQLTGEVEVAVVTSSFAKTDRDRASSYARVRAFIEKPLTAASLRAFVGER